MTKDKQGLRTPLLSVLDLDHNGNLSEHAFLSLPTVDNLQKFPHRCTGNPSRGTYAVILVSHYANPGENSDERILINGGQGRDLKYRLEQNEPIAGHKIAGVELVLEAKRSHLEDALLNPEVGSIVLMGHATVNSWPDSLGVSTTYDRVRNLVAKANHCKTGIGLKVGCNGDAGVSYLRYQLLAPAYGHAGHPGSLLTVQGPPGSPDSSYGLTATTSLIRWIPPAGRK
jgi:hypothetical protein